MSRKRRNTSSPECESPPISPAVRNQQDYYESESESEDYVDSEEKPQVHASTGQAGAFPGLGDSGELFYGPANDGVDYLRMVRSEAQGIPQLLKAHQSEDEHSLDGSGTWDGDGTYVGKSQVSTATNIISQAQQKYSQSVLMQFETIRAAMQSVPPLSAVEKLKSSQPISFPRDNKNARQTWEAILKNQDPNPTQVACMDQNSLFQVIQLLEWKMRSLLQADIAQVNRVGAWIWSILAKCPDRGQLDPEETSLLRKLAQKAVEMIVALDRPEATGDMKNTGFAADDIAAARKNLSHAVDIGYDTADSTLPATKLQEEKFVLLDIIILVVGEVYGQRDLLDQRKIWKG